MTDKLARPRAEELPSTIHNPGGPLPNCPDCGGTIGFAANPGNAFEWWRCTKCQKMFAVRRQGPCAHEPTPSTCCAVCGGQGRAVTVTVRERRADVTLHFCSAAHAIHVLGGSNER